MRLCALLLLGFATGLAAEPADPPLEASLVATPTKALIATSESTIPVRLVLTNTGRRPLAIVRSSLGSAIWIKYTPDVNDDSRKAGSWGRNVVPLIQSGEPFKLPDSEYVILAPGEAYRTEIDIASSLRELGPYGLVPGVYLIDFSYSYEPNRAERSVPLIQTVRASEPVRITVGAGAERFHEVKSFGGSS